MINKAKHYHEYQRSKTNKDIYRCIHPECNHYTHRQFIEGKRSECHDCKKLFIVPKEQLKNKFLRCELCNKSKKAEDTNIAKNIIGDTLLELAKEERENELIKLGEI